ncbi:TetR/AcrR family transcriptional regulator [Phytoactinopolyspora halotolerans]|uniref:TetR/AcrR family transcriptional regulator n=1 Tax=Phytoactinopolyspora halotolerans TaxID=1981512 RepID=A0A6L9SCK3_9ACTN|nr:TetR/AcrR family transcriptional regulator [Phytoactinopolyspora halotolerans]NEE02956.1 TetR/AcrR family transcriptional regulator [Phytoactinopolyspora halotolerans]
MSASDLTGPQSGYASAPDELLILRTSPPKERADAARNRSAVLEAAARLFGSRGVEDVSMDAIAAEAGVGKGTLFRRFGDKAGLATALLDERERELQERILFGPAPLGPGQIDDAPSPGDRLRAFVEAYLDYALEHLGLVRMSETASPGARYRIGAYRFWHRHVALLLAEASNGGTLDADAIAHAVLAPLAAEHLHAVVSEHGEDRVRAATLTVVTTLLAAVAA